MGERLRRHAEAEIDRFWAQRLEATFQQEKVKPQKEAILAVYEKRVAVAAFGGANLIEE